MTLEHSSYADVLQYPLSFGYFPRRSGLIGAVYTKTRSEQEKDKVSTMRNLAETLSGFSCGPIGEQHHARTQASRGDEFQR